MRAAPTPPLFAAVPGLEVRPGFEQPTLLVPAAHWRSAVTVCRDHPQLALSLLDMLAGVDYLDHVAVVAHLFSPSLLHHALLEVSLDRTAPRLDSVAHLFASADWHERETFEMFGVDFAGHPDLRGLLLSDSAMTHPLRKSLTPGEREQQ